MLRQCATLLSIAPLAQGFHITAPRAVSLSGIRRFSCPPHRALLSPDVDTLAKEKMEEQEESQTFNWNKQWYPVACVQDTDSERAHSIQLLGKELVLWRDGQGRWACFDDRCPHRAAPLTEGRVEKDGSLMCAYHGWRFDSTGKCLSIPQSDRAGKDEARPAACTKAYPTQVVQDLIWVWADAGPDAPLESALTPPALIKELNDKELNDEGRVVPLTVAHRDMAYGWDYLMENVLDPSHVPIAHHGVIGDRYKDAAPIPRSLGVSPVTKAGFSYEHSTCVGKGTTSFHPPALVEVNNEMDDGSMLNIKIYGIPTRPGHSRIFGRQVLVKGNRGGVAHAFTPSGILGKLLPVLATVVPRWMGHVYGSLFLHQDLVFLHHQEKTLGALGYDSSNYHEGVYTPTSADRTVHSLRQWISRFGQGGPTWDPLCDRTLPPREYDRNVLFDVYQNHTKDCSTCMKALKNVNRSLEAAKLSVVISIIWMVLRGASAFATLGSPAAPVINQVTAKAMLPGFAATLASLGAVKVIKFVQSMFHTYPYSHQDNN